MPYDYRTVKDQYDMLAEAGVVKEPLEEWSARMNRESGTDAYSAGLESNFIKNASVAIDRALEYTGLPGLTEQFGREVGSIVGAPEAGAAIGKSLPRQTVNFAPMLLSTTPLAPLGIAASAGLSGAEAYTATGSPAAGVIAAGTNIAMPGVGRFAGQYALKKLGAEAVEGAVLKGGVDRLQQLAAGVAPTMVKEYVPTTLGQGLAAYGAEQVAGSALGAAGGQLESVFSGQPYEFSPTTELLNMTLGQLPFAALSASKQGRVMFGGETARQHKAELETSIKLTRDAMEQHRLNEEETARTPIEENPDTPEMVEARAQRATKLSELRERQRAAKADGTTVAENERQKLADEDNSLLSEQGPLPGHILGVPAAELPKRPVLDPMAPPEDPVIRLKTAEQRMAAAKDNVDLQDAIVEVNEVRGRYGLAHLDDAEIAARQRQFDLGSDRDAIQSHIDETRRLATAREEGQQLRVEMAAREAELGHPDPLVQATARTRLDEIRAASESLDNVRHIANAPLNRDTAPVKNFMHEHALRITESAPESNPGDQQKFLDYVQGGVNAMMQKHGMSRDSTIEFLEKNPRVESWRNRLEVQVGDGLSLQEYSERHLRNQGVGEEEARQQAALVSKLSETPDLTNNLLAIPAQSAESKKAFAGMQELLASDPKPTADVFAERGVANADELYEQFVRSGHIDEDALDLLDGKVVDYIHARAREHRQLADVMKSAETAEYVRSPIESPDSVLGPLRKIADAEAKRAQQAADLSGVAGVSPKTYMENLLSGSLAPTAVAKRAVKDPRTWGFLADPLDTAVGAWQRVKDVFKTPAYLARVSPHMAEFVAKGHQLAANARKMSMEAFKAFGMDETGKFKKEFTRAIQDKQTTAALSAWMGINNKRGQKTGEVRLVPANDPEVARVLRDLPEEKQQMAKELMARNVISVKNMQRQELGKMLEIYGVQGAEFLGPQTGFKYDKNLRLSNDMLSVLQTNWSDQAQAARAQDTMARLQTELQAKPGLFTELQRTMEGKMTEFREKQQFFEKNPAWNTAERYGKWNFTYRKGNKTVMDSADSRAEAQRIAGDNPILAITRNNDNENTAVQYDRTVPPEMMDARWFSNHATWLNKNATYWSRELYKAQTKAMLADPELGQRPDIQRLARQHADNMLSPDPKYGMAANRLTSVWLMGWNAASAMANGSQLIVRGAAEMSRLTGNPIDSYKRIIGAYKEMYNPAGMNEEHRKVVRRLAEDGVTSGIDDSLITGEEDSGADIQRTLSGRGPLKSPVDNLSRVYQNVGMYLFRKVERSNNTGAVLAAYDYYRGQKDAFGRQLSVEDAYQQALVFNRSVNDVGGKANRPIDLLSGKGDVSKTLGLMATSLQTYNLGSINQIASYIKNGFFDQPGLTPAEKFKNKIALAHLFGAQLTVAGVMGMPFVATAAAIIDQIFPAAETGKHVRDWVNGVIPKFLEDDEEDGGIVADMAMTGIPSMFGWDLQGRLSMGNPLSGVVSDVNGFQPELLFGAPFGVAGKFLSGLQAAWSGDTRFVGSMVPPAIKKFTDTAFGDGKVRDYNGKPILEQPTLGEKTGIFLGFQPTRVSEFNKANRMSNRAKQVHREEDRKFNMDRAEEVLKGNFGDVQKALRAKVDEDSEFDWVSSGRKIADAAVERYFPRDLRRELSPRDARIAKMFPIDPVRATEVERRNFRGWVLQNLGVPYKPRDEAKYALMDQIEQENPGKYTKTEKMRMAEKAMGKAKPRPEMSEAAYTAAAQ